MKLHCFISYMLGVREKCVVSRHGAVSRYIAVYCALGFLR